MTTGTTILLVDDEESIQKLLTFPLERDGYRVVQARDGEEALERFREEDVDLVLLDLALPKLDGIEVCRRLRAESTVPILMLTARDDEIDKVLGLEIGADDYITKPFSIRELRSRIRAAIRRAALTPAAEAEDVIESDGLRIDLPRRSVEVRGEGVQLTYLEFELLRTLAATPGRVYSRQTLLDRLWGGAAFRDPAHDRRPRAPPAGEDRARPERPRVHLHRSRRGVPVPGLLMARRAPSSGDAGGQARIRLLRRGRRRVGDRLPDGRPAARRPARGREDQRGRACASGRPRQPRRRSQ